MGHVRKGENIQYVDLQTIQWSADFKDKVHPNAVGFQKMGEAWAGAIMNTIGPYSELCLDEDKPRFIDVDSDDKQKSCKWLRNRKDKARIDIICSSNDDAKQHCKVTCGTCPISIGPTSTIHPSLTSSILPTTTTYPSFAPTNSPTKTQLPTATLFFTPEVCDNGDGYAIDPDDTEGKTIKCWQKKKKLKKFCAKDFFSSVCRKKCSLCTPIVPTTIRI